MMDCGRYFSLTSAYGNFDRNRVWPLNLLSLVETPIIIGEQYFRFDANCEEMFFFQSGKKDLSLLDMIRAQKQHLNYKNQSLASEKNLCKKLDNKWAISDCINLESVQ